MSSSLFYQFTWAWIGLALVAFAYLLRRNAPYGRHIQPGWGPTLSNRLGWFLMEFTVIVVFLMALLWESQPISGPVWFFSSCFLLHYLNRSIIFPLRMRTAGKRMPVIIVASAMSFNLVNGFLLGYCFANLSNYGPDWWTDARFLVGLTLFGSGLALNWYSDNQLISLRKPGSTGYTIPQGGMFRWVSCPNLLGEMVEWTGFALMTWCLPSFAFMVWTIANLAPRAIAHHRWY
ncbi:MAG: DUF1295 domain-containing protein, partial [Saprospiraceae bacterium]|nr:DUF1295 domain-containing protein [Saprospiraceae bacterium]